MQNFATFLFYPLIFSTEKMQVFDQFSTVQVKL